LLDKCWNLKFIQLSNAKLGFAMSFLRLRILIHVLLCWMISFKEQQLALKRKNNMMKSLNKQVNYLFNWLQNKEWKSKDFKNSNKSWWKSKKKKSQLMLNREDIDYNRSFIIFIQIKILINCAKSNIIILTNSIG
jgi:isocitrate dehydrogenase